MIASKSRDGRRGKGLRATRLLERLFKEGKCRECSVVVTRMDFAKILGKFTKVKIQYESSSPKSQKTFEVPTSKSNARLKNNENGIVKIHRNSHNKQSSGNTNVKRNKTSDVSTPSLLTNNILKENNRLKKNITPKDIKPSSKQLRNICKQYAIIFNEPTNNNNNDITSEFSLSNLLPHLDKSVLPSAEWCIDYFPKNEEPQDDKVYDRIAAELEDLMCNEKPELKCRKASEDKVDEFPSIMDILNDNTEVNNADNKSQHNSLEIKSNLDSSDVEAMLLGETNSSDQVKEPEPMETDTKIINDVDKENTDDDISEKGDKLSDPSEANDFENPSSPSILDEALQKGIEEHLPMEQSQNRVEPEIPCIPKDEQQKVADEENTETIPPVILNDKSKQNGIQDVPEESTPIKSDVFALKNIENITYVTFKKLIDGNCCKAVTCPKNLKYTIELDNKSVEFLGAPKYISSLDDLQVLLQIVNESDLESLHVLH